MSTKVMDVDGTIQSCSDKDLLKICTDFRNGIIGRKASVNKCYIVSAPLHCYLNYLKVDCTLINGNVIFPENKIGHFWIELKDGRIIDPTADQFNCYDGINMPKVYFGKKPAFYKPIRKKRKEKNEHI